MRPFATIAALVASLSPLAWAQQYAGDTIKNSLPAVPGSEIAYFRINDPSGKNNNLTLINYYSLQGSGQRVVPSQLQRAVVVIHGNARDPGTYMSEILSAIRVTTSDKNINTSSVVMMAPYFPNGDDKNKGYPWTDGLPPGQGSTSNCLVWTGSKWAAGSYNQYPDSSHNTSSFDVIDQVLEFWGNKAMFPNMKQIVVAGHSEGAQFVQHYAAIGKKLAITTPVSYWVANPNSYLWFSTSRPFSTASCPTYDTYRDGFFNFTEYPMRYGVNAVAAGRASVLATFNTRAINYARGTQDFGDDSSDCAPFAQGQNRNERFFEFISAFPPSCPSSNNCDTVDYVVSGHDAGKMMASAAGQARLFTDNFYGKGHRAYDFGYPREQPGDDPHPNPALVNDTNPTNTKVYAGSKTYYGCWSDQTPATLPTLLYSNSSNTIEFCTTACTNAGYSIAGVEYGKQCFCGNALGYEAVQVTNTSCQIACAGNAGEICGGNNRMSLFSKGKPAVNTAPIHPDSVSGFSYYGCQTEATSGRALSAKSLTSNSMTLENCAQTCAGYRYWGAEYSDECYCGNSFGAGSQMASSDGACNMLCANNTAEYCGGSNLLTVYQNSSWVAQSSSSAASSSSASAPTSGKTTVISGSSSTTATATSTPSSSGLPTCPGSNNTQVTYNGRTFAIECGIDHFAGDMAVASVSNFAQCIDTCATNSSCVDVSYSGVACYLKSSLGAPVYNQVWGARLLGTAAGATPSSATNAMQAAFASATADIRKVAKLLVA